MSKKNDLSENYTVVVEIDLPSAGVKKVPCKSKQASEG